MAKLINGLAIAKEIRQELKQHIIEWEVEGHRAPHLTAVLIGDDPASHTYVNNKIKVCHTLSLSSHSHDDDVAHTIVSLIAHPFCFSTHKKYIGSGRSWN